MIELVRIEPLGFIYDNEFERFQGIDSLVYRLQRSCGNDLKRRLPLVESFVPFAEKSAVNNAYSSFASKMTGEIVGEQRFAGSSLAVDYCYGFAMGQIGQASLFDSLLNICQEVSFGKKGRRVIEWRYKVIDRTE